MRRILFALLGLVLLSGSVSLAVTTVAATTVQEKGFETGLDGMQGWYNTNGVGRTSSTANSGEWSLDVDAENYWGIEEQWPGGLSVTPGEELGISGWAKVSAGRKQAIEATVFFVNEGQSGTVGVESVGVVTAIASKWKEFSGTVVVPEGAATVGFRFEGPRSGHVYLDDIRVTSDGTGPSPSPSPTVTASPEPTPTVTASPTPSPTPTPTTSPEPTATATATPTAPSGDNVCTRANTIYLWDDWGAAGLGEYYADAGWWNAGGYDVQQTTGVCSHSSFFVEAVVPDHQDNAVLTYPNMHKDYHHWGTGHEPLVSSFDKIDVSFAHETTNRSGIYNVAFDAWLNGVGGDANEIMIWTENFNQRPAGSKIGTASLNGYSWDVWATSNNLYIAFVPVGGVEITSGVFDMIPFFNWLIDNGRLPTNSTVGQIDYGVEIVSTSNSLVRWDFTDFTISDGGYTVQY